VFKNANIVPKTEKIPIKRWLCVALVIFFVFEQPNKMFAQTHSHINTVVIDAGHGGKDPGALGKHSREKDITLKVALKLGRYIKQNLPGVKVIYTRTKDRFVGLKKRGEIANKHNADVFISIHCNSNHSTKLYGAETYVLGSDYKRSKRNMKVAMMENAAILLEEDAQNSYNGFDPNSPQSYIIFSLKQNDYKQKQSLILADKIQTQFKNRVGRKDRGIYQAGFLVLAGTYMPSVLVELGYISNPKEEKFLLSGNGQTYMASAIYRAFKRYKIEYEKENDAYNYRKTILKKDKAITTKPKPTEPKVSATAKQLKLEYRVQFYISPYKISLSSNRFGNIGNLAIYFQNGTYKYTSGHYGTLNEALIQQKLLHKKGYHDAFAVAFYNGKRISIKKAKQLEEK